MSKLEKLCHYVIEDIICIGYDLAIPLQSENSMDECTWEGIFKEELLR
jgi:hypothetical protein